MTSPYLEAVRERIVIFDGATGTTIQARELTHADFGGKEGCNEFLVITRPDVIRSLHESFLAAGCDVVETDTFGGSRLKLGEYGLADRVNEINRAAAALARSACDAAAGAGRRRFVAGSVGPTGLLPSSSDPTLGNIRFDELAAVFEEQGRGLLQGGVDLFVIETMQDILELKSAVFGLRRAMRAEGRTVPIQAQVTLDTSGRMLMGTDIAAALVTLEGLEVDVVGLNCSTGPQHMREPVRYLCEHTALPVSVIPNAGLPLNVGGRAVYPMEPLPMADQLAQFVADFGVNIVGGCCGTTPEHIHQLVIRVADRPAPTRRPPCAPAVSSAIRAMTLHQEPPPMLVGERVNVVGSRRVKRLLLKDDYDGVLQVARQQVDGGAHALDVQVAMTERSDEREMMVRTVKLLAAGVEAPLVIDTTEFDVMKAALEQYPGRAVVNSINLENRAERVDRWLPVIKEHGAAVVAMTIDEAGMAKTAETKAAVARRVYDIAVGEHGFRPEALIFDPQVFPLVTGQEDLRDSAIQTIDGIRQIEAALPGVMTILGISNVSFGVGPSARRVLNSVFLYHAVEAGLDLAIVNAAEVRPYAEIPLDQRELADDLVFNRRPDALQRFIEFFEAHTLEEESTGNADPLAGMSTDEQIHYQVLHRKKDGIEALLDQAIAERMGLSVAPAADERPTAESSAAAVSVLNRVLLPAMKEVGDKFGAGELILPFVLQSAEVMKRAVGHLEEFLERKAGATKGTVVLATVFGDVHDIGKSLVNTILSNNGYTVHDLGKQVPLNTIIDKAVELNATAIGLSALLVSTSRQMPLCVQELASRGLSFPVIIGGAAINRKYGQKILFVKDGEPYRAGVFFAKDAFEGLAIMDHLTDVLGREQFVEEIIRDAAAASDLAAGGLAESRRYQAAPPTARSNVERDVPIPTPPFWGYRVRPNVDPPAVWRCLDLNSLFRFQWGGGTNRKRPSGADAYRQLVEQEFEPLLAHLQETTVRDGIIVPSIISGYFPCNADGNDLILYEPRQHDRVIGRMSFPRQTSDEHLCIADYFAPVGSGRVDVLPMQIVTVGSRVSEQFDELQRRGDYSAGYYLHGLAVTTTEALAAYSNEQIRRELGLPGEQGKRFSWGYGACPNLADQAVMFRVLPGQEIGVSLTEGFQLTPDQSTAAFIVHHPAAKYFSTYKHGPE